MNILELEISNSNICEDIVNNIVYFKRLAYINWKYLTLKYVKTLLIILSILKDEHTWIGNL
jgi:hypothetical protein